MPIKFPKSFARRKSAGNALESCDTQPGSSFRVLDRSEIADRYAAAAAAATTAETRRFSFRRLSSGRPLSSPTLQVVDEPYEFGSRGSDRISGRTNNSCSTTGTSSTARFSYISTDPSSVDSAEELHNRASNSRLKYSQTGNASVPPRPQPSPQLRSQSESLEDDDELFGPALSLTTRGRTFSFGPRPEDSSPSPSQRNPTHTTPRPDRERATTTSSYASTATPQNVNQPQSMPWEESGFGRGGLNLTGGSGARRLPDIPTPPAPVARSDSDSMLEPKGAFSFTTQSQPVPLSSRLDKSPPPNLASFSPRSFDSNGSQDAFLPHPREQRKPSPEPDSFIRRGSTSSVEPDDQLVLDAVYAVQALDAEHGVPTHHPLPEPPQFETQHLSPSPPRSASRSPAGRARASPLSARRAQTVGGAEELTGDEDSEISVIRRPERRTLPHTGMTPTAKVLTPAEFALLKNQQLYERDDDSASEKSADSDGYEDEDDMERNRQIAKQRKRQEAHLAVYRQQMMKVTGERTPDPPRPSAKRASQSAPNLFGDAPALDLKLGAVNEKSSDESDEDIPLGVLQAHGFPNKIKPPSRLSTPGTSTPRSASQASSYPAPPGSTRNDPSAGGGGGPGLPVFARHLPQDPYVGASLVNQSNREAPQQSSTPPPGPPPPGGLVGVIVGEERARALRRGSPNTNGTYGPTPPQPSPSPPAVMHQMGMPGMMGYPPEQAQVEMTNSMAQMMQMQMQWMQQMMQMQGMPMTPQMQMMQQQLQQQSLSPLPPPQQRPDSLLVPPPANRRTSMMSQPGVRGHGHTNSFGGGLVAPSAQSVYNMQPPNAGYAASIAPSERSGVGQPSRYRPVGYTTPGSNSESNKHSRTSTPSMSHATLPGLDVHRNRSPEKKGPLTPLQNLPSAIRAVSRPKHGAASDDEDEEGWAEMRRKHDERRGRWRERRPADPAPADGLEGLYYNE